MLNQPKHKRNISYSDVLLRYQISQTAKRLTNGNKGGSTYHLGKECFKDFFYEM